MRALVTRRAVVSGQCVTFPKQRAATLRFRAKMSSWADGCCRIEVMKNSIEPRDLASQRSRGSCANGWRTSTQFAHSSSSPSDDPGGRGGSDFTKAPSTEGPHLTNRETRRGAAKSIRDALASVNIPAAYTRPSCHRGLCRYLLISVKGSVLAATATAAKYARKASKGKPHALPLCSTKRAFFNEQRISSLSFCSCSAELDSSKRVDPFLQH